MQRGRYVSNGGASRGMLRMTACEALCSAHEIINNLASASGVQNRSWFFSFLGDFNEPFDQSSCLQLKCIKQKDL